MTNPNEIKALLHLLDDPDELVFSTVSARIVSLGTNIIPNLEDFWLTAEDEHVQQRIENLIQRVSLTEIKSKFSEWEKEANTGKSSLYEAMKLLCQYAHPNVKENKIDRTLKNMHRSCWLELNNYLTPLEEVHIINSIVYSMYKFTADRNSLKDQNTYYLCDVLESRKGNQYTMAMLYLIVTQMLDIPIFAMKISNFIVMGYVSNLYDFNDPNKNTKATTQFFIEPTEGTILSRQDVDSFIKKYDVKIDDNSFTPLKNKEFVYHYTHALSRAYSQAGDEDRAQDVFSIVKDLLPDDD